MPLEKMVQLIVFLPLFVTFMGSHCHGLELYFSQDLEKEPCGTLFCLHEIDVATDAYNRSITRISIFRQIDSTTNELLYALDSNNSMVNIVSNDTEIIGSLSTKRASLKANIFKDGGCINSDFLCRVTTTDTNKNNESLSSFTSSKIAQAKSPPSFDYSLILNATASINDRIDHLEKQLDDSSHTMENKMTDKISHIENKIDQLNVKVEKEKNDTEVLVDSTRHILTAFRGVLNYMKSLTTSQNSSFTVLKILSWNILYEMGQLAPLPNTTNIDQFIDDTFDQHFKNITENKNTSVTMPTSCERDMAYRKDIIQMAEPFIIPGQAGGFPLLCDGKTDGGGWIVIQRRINGLTDFFRDWDQYKNGFGSFHENFWLGNEKISQLTNVEDFATYELRVILKYEGKDYYAHYSNFRLDSEENEYRLYVNDYNGTAGDGLAANSGNPFGTKDRDTHSSWHYYCGLGNKSGTWCFNERSNESNNINGLWGQRNGAFWRPLTSFEPVSFSQMMIRKLQYTK